MARKESFVLVSLKENKAKQLAQVIANDSCRKILDYLAEKEATESELSKYLNIPISTVHYNLQQLQTSGLIAAEEFHYSEKGKEVNHYKLVNKYVIIAPKSIFGLKEKLKSILPVVLIIGAAAGFMQLLFKRAVFGAKLTAPIMETALENAVPQAAGLAADAAPKAAEYAVEETISTIAQTQAIHSFVLWFVIGTLSSLAVYLLIDWLRKR
jgi:DNA-binding transcriptional ArsR family regulator